MKNPRFKEQFIVLLTELGAMEVVAREAARSYLELTEQRVRLSELDFKLEDSDSANIVFSGQVRCSRNCCYDYESVSVPLEFIQDSEAYSVKYKEEQVIKNKQKGLDAELQKVKKEKQAKQQKKEQYEKLKKEFE